MGVHIILSAQIGAEGLLSLAFSSLLPWVSQTRKTEEFIFQNVAYRPTAYETWLFTIKEFEAKFYMTVLLCRKICQIFR